MLLGVTSLHRCGLCKNQTSLNAITQIPRILAVLKLQLIVFSQWQETALVRRDPALCLWKISLWRCLLLSTNISRMTVAHWYWNKAGWDKVHSDGFGQGTEDGAASRNRQEPFRLMQVQVLAQVLSCQAQLWWHKSQLELYSHRRCCLQQTLACAGKEVSGTNAMQQVCVWLLPLGVSPPDEGTQQ